MSYYRSPEALEWHKLYNTSKWRKHRARFLAEHPLCVYCSQQSRVEPATVADHITPHRGDLELFWDAENLQALCATHHSSTKQREEHAGIRIAHDQDGYPLDPQHPANGGKL